MNEVMVRKIAFDQMIELQIHQASKEMSSLRVASTEHQRLIRAWSQPEILKTMVYAGIGDWLRNVKDKAKKWVSDSVLKAWDAVRGQLEKFKLVFQNSRALQALTQTVGDITPEAIKSLLKKGEVALKKLFKNIKAILMTKSEAPTLTDLIKRTVIAGKLSDIYYSKIQPKVEIVDEFLKKHIPNLRRPIIAAIFIFIWMNVDELSWEWSDLTMGFSGALSLSELLTTFPESAIGFLTGRLFGIGFKIMPYMIAARLLWLLRRKYLTWDASRGYQVNPKKVDMALFKAADKAPEYRSLTV